MGKIQGSIPMSGLIFPLVYLVLLITTTIIGLVGLANGTDKGLLYERCHLVASLTALVLFFAIIGACRGGPRWRAIAIVGWLYFLLGRGPWFHVSHTNGNIQDNTVLLTSQWLIDLCGLYVPRWVPGEVRITNQDYPSNGYTFRLALTTGIGHYLLTLLFANVGGLLAGLPGPRRRSSLAYLMLFVAITAVGSAGLAAGTLEWFCWIDSLTVLALFLATIGACRGGLTWRAVAIIGWLYFPLGLGPWFNTLGAGSSLRTFNDDLITSHWLPELSERFVPKVPAGHPDYSQLDYERYFRVMNTAAIGHCLLTLLFAAVGGGLANLWGEERASSRSSQAAEAPPGDGQT